VSEKFWTSLFGAFIGASLLVMPVVSQDTPQSERKWLDPAGGNASISKTPTKLFGWWHLSD
jgi:hypothetical protein